MLPPSFRYFLRNHYQRRPLLTVGCTPGVYALSGEGFRELPFFSHRGPEGPRDRRGLPTNSISALNAYSCCCGSTRGDLVDSTALSVRFDPEDQREIVGAYHRYVAEMA